jgi:hypothetical protein
MARRRRGSQNALTIIYWRDIPAQVTASADGATHKTLLEPRFQHAIDRAATVADLTETSAYVAQWRRASRPFDGDPSEAERVAAELAQRYPRQRLEDLVAQGGLEARPEADRETDDDRVEDHQEKDAHP